MDICNCLVEPQNIYIHLAAIGITLLIGLLVLVASRD